MAIIDDAISTLKDVFEGGADNWKDRLSGSIRLTSPEGTEFNPKYRGGDSFKLEKRLGYFDYPLIRGTVLQDLDTSGMRISLIFHFDGVNNDVNARAFLSACKERGTWQCVHPVHGEYELQLISVSLINTNNGITKLSSEWIEPLDPERLKTARELAGIVDNQITTLNGGALAQFVDDVNDASATLKHVIETTTNGIENVVDWALYPLFGTVDALDTAITAVHAGIQDALNAVVIPLESLAGQIQQLIEFPALASRDITSRTDAYVDSLTAGLYELLPGESKTSLQRTSSDEAEINNIITTELALSAIIASLSRIAITSDFETREQALDMIGTLTDTFKSIIEKLEEKQSEYYSNYIDRQYFSQSSTFNDAVKLVYQTVRFLLAKSFDLKIKHIIKLDRPTTPIQLVGEYYNDFEQLGFFCDTNSLQGSEIILLPAGKEVAIYV